MSPRNRKKFQAFQAHNCARLSPRVQFTWSYGCKANSSPRPPPKKKQKTRRSFSLKRLRSYSNFSDDIREPLAAEYQHWAAGIMSWYLRYIKLPGKKGKKIFKSAAVPLKTCTFFSMPTITPQMQINFKYKIDVLSQAPGPQTKLFAFWAAELLSRRARSCWAGPFLMWSYLLMAS